MPAASPVRFAISITVGLGVFLGSLYGLLFGSTRVLLGITAGYLGYEVLVALGLGLAAVAGIRSWQSSLPRTTNGSASATPWRASAHKPASALRSWLLATVPRTG